MSTRYTQYAHIILREGVSPEDFVRAYGHELRFLLGKYRQDRVPGEDPGTVVELCWTAEIPHDDCFVDLDLVATLVSEDDYLVAYCIWEAFEIPLQELCLCFEGPCFSGEGGRP